MMIFVFGYLSSCNSKLSIETAQFAVNGQKLYALHCQNCHGQKGEGLGKLYPPLTDSAYLNKNRALLSCIVRHGMEGEVEVNGIVYNGIMPKNTDLTEIDIAYILTYITTYFGNSTTIYSANEVKEALENCSN